MMTLTESVKILNLFFNKFCPAYINNIVPNNAIFPYLTYSVEVPNFEEEGNIIVRIYNKGKEDKDKFKTIPGKIYINSFLKGNERLSTPRNELESLGFSLERQSQKKM